MVERKVLCTLCLFDSHFPRKEPVESERIQNVLREIRKRITDLEIDGKEYAASDLKSWKIHVVSRNNFPTASGLASSASGYAALGNSALHSLFVR